MSDSIVLKSVAVGLCHLLSCCHLFPPPELSPLLLTSYKLWFVEPSLWLLCCFPAHTLSILPPPPKSLQRRFPKESQFLPGEVLLFWEPTGCPCRSVWGQMSAYSANVFSFRYSKQDCALQGAAALPPEEHCGCRCRGGRNPSDHSGAVARADHVHQEETGVVSGSQSPPFFQELMGVCTSVARSSPLLLDLGGRGS